MNFSDLFLAVFGAGSAPDAATQLRLMAEMGRMIAQRLRAIEMWNQPPEYFGYSDLRHWRDAFPPDYENNSDAYATADATVDFYTDKLLPAVGAEGSLARLIANSKSADTSIRNDAVQAIPRYIAVAIHNFLIDRQKKQDAIGYRVFANLEAVIEELAAEDVVDVIGRQERRGQPPRIRRDSTVKFRGPKPTEPPRASVVNLVLAADSLRGNVHKLCKKGKGAQRLLRPAIEALPAAGVESFEFGELLTPLQEAVRETVRLWAEGSNPVRTEAEGADGEKISTNIRIANRSNSYATLDEYLGVLANAVRAMIDEQVAQERTRTGLHRLLTEWFAHLSETGADEAQELTLDEWVCRLGTKRSTLAEHMDRLRDLVRQAQSRLDGEQ